MTGIYEKFRHGVATGGADDTDDQRSTVGGRLTGAVIVALLLWLAIKSPVR